jgi:predicted DNA binding CopG/RHH family protein
MRQKRGNSSKKNRARKTTSDEREAQARESREQAPAPKPLQLAKREQIIAPHIEDVTEVMNFIENYKRMLDPRAKKRSKLISIKIPEPLLEAFRYKAEREKTPYQTKIKQLMMEYLEAHP